MKTMSARDAKNAFGLMIDTARAEPVRIEKHGRAVVMVLSVEEYQRLRDGADGAGIHSGKISAKSIVKRTRTQRA
jgi:prevent-host-death family protein